MHVCLYACAWSPLCHLWGMNRQELSVLLKDNLTAYLEIHGHNFFFFFLASSDRSFMDSSTVNNTWWPSFFGSPASELCFIPGKLFPLHCVLTLWKAKYTQLQQFGGQSRHGKAINKTTEAKHRGNMAHPWSVPPPFFFKQLLFFSPSKLPNDDKPINLHH